MACLPDQYFAHTSSHHLPSSSSSFASTSTLGHQTPLHSDGDHDCGGTTNSAHLIVRINQPQCFCRSGGSKASSEMVSLVIALVASLSIAFASVSVSIRLVEVVAAANYSK